MTQQVAEEVVRIKEAARRVLAGESVWSIASDWRDEGVPTVTGRPWTVQTLTSILRSGRIAGLREHKGLVVGQGRWKAVIESDLHELLVVALDEEEGRPPRSHLPAGGLLRCGKCGGPLRSLARETAGGRTPAGRVRDSTGVGGSAFRPTASRPTYVTSCAVCWPTPALECRKPETTPARTFGQARERGNPAAARVFLARSTAG